MHMSSSNNTQCCCFHRESSKLSSLTLFRLPSICPLGEKSLRLKTFGDDFESVLIYAWVPGRVCSRTVHPFANVPFCSAKGTVAAVTWHPGTHFQSSETLGRFASASVLVSSTDMYSIAVPMSSADGLSGAVPQQCAVLRTSHWSVSKQVTWVCSFSWAHCICSWSFITNWLVSRKCPWQRLSLCVPWGFVRDCCPPSRPHLKGLSWV